MVHPEARIHPSALVEEGAVVGARTRVWAFSHILSGAVVGTDCNVCDHTFIETGVRIGNQVTVKCGVYLWDGVVVEDEVFIGPAAVFTNDLSPRSGQHPAAYANTHLAQGCSVGANATILAGHRIGRYALVGAGAVVTRAIPDYGLAVGNPAQIIGWVAPDGSRLDFDPEGLARQGKTIYRLAGGLVAIDSDLP